MINTEHEAIDIEKGNKLLGFKTFSSCGNSLSTLFGRPMKVKINDESNLDLIESKVLPDIPKNSYLNLIQIDSQKNSTAESMQLCIDVLCKVIPSYNSDDFEKVNPKDIIDMLKPINNYIVDKASILISKLDSDIHNRRSFISLMRLQQSINEAIGLNTNTVENLSNYLVKNNGIGISSIGLGKGGVLLSCYETIHNQNYIKSLNDNVRSKFGNFSLIKPHGRAELCFSGIPLRYHKFQKWEE